MDPMKIYENNVDAGILVITSADILLYYKGRCIGSSALILPALTPVLCTFLDAKLSANCVFLASPWQTHKHVYKRTVT